MERTTAQLANLLGLRRPIDAAGPTTIRSLQSNSAAATLAIALLAVAIALFARLELLAGLEDRLAYITLYPAVTIASVAGGCLAGTLATGLAALAASLWLSPLREPSDWLGMATFLAACALIVAVTEAMHRAQTRASEAETEARLADAVRESEARLKAVIETAADGIVTIDEKGIVQSFNPAASRLFAYAPEEVIGRNVSLLMPEDQRLQDFPGIGRGRIIGSSREVQGCRKGGALFPIDLAVSETLLGGCRLFIGMLRDISERKLAEERQRELTGELRKSETEARCQHALFQGVFNSAPEAMVLTDMGRQIVMVNAPFERLFGYVLEDVTGPATPKICANEDEWRRIGDAVFGASGKARAEPQTGQFRRKDGQVFVGEMVASLFADPGGAALGYIGVIRDVTIERKREAAQRQGQRLEVIGQLTGGVAHDFNNLLTVIIGNLELLEGEIHGDPQRAVLRKAFEAADMGQRLTHRLLTFARKQTLSPERTSFNEIVLSLTDMLRRTLGPQIELVTALEPNLWPAVADRGQIESALLNLALNARDAMPRGGTLSIRTSNVEVAPSPDNGEALRPGPYVRLSVADTGEGMPAAVRARAFEPFFTTKGAGRGTGLGLATIYGFAKQSGGTATIESEVKRGTTVDLLLPAELLQAAPAGGKESIMETNTRGRTHRVLVVEDDRAVRELTVNRLKNLGCQVIEASDGVKALAVLDSGERVDLIFTDLIMPGGVSGLDLCEIVRTRWPHIRLLLTSGYAEELTNPERLERLKLKLLRKPYRQAELAGAIEAVMSV